MVHLEKVSLNFTNKILFLRCYLGVAGQNLLLEQRTVGQIINNLYLFIVIFRRCLYVMFNHNQTRFT